MSLEIGLLWAGTIALALGSLAGWAALIWGGKRPGQVVLSTAALGLALLGLSIVLRWVRVGHGPYINVLEVLSSSVWVGVAILVALLWRRESLRLAAGPVLGLSVLLLGWGVLSSPEVEPLPATFESVWLMIHIGFAKVAYGSILVASAVAFAYLVRERRGRGAQDPELGAALAGLDDLGYRLVAFGFIAVTFMVAAGALWAQEAWGRYWDWDPIETWALATWIAYGLFLHVRITWRVKGKASAWAILFLLGLSVFAFFVISRVAATVHTEFMVD
ncbi:MAG: cytochrome c biogenesis protein CcsA [Deltaproteobacteria bacterium]|nr:cytochrome c biogenesis protein CcsA [Deltaproteobacteria bacterium]